MEGRQQTIAWLNSVLSDHVLTVLQPPEKVIPAEPMENFPIICRPKFHLRTDQKISD